jgi:hypothetical protein
VQRIDGVPEVGLRAGHHPIEIERLSARARRLVPGQTGLAAILNAAAAGDLTLDLELEVEVFGFQITAPDIGVGNKVVLVGFTNDGAILHTPDGGISLPVGETLAIEYLRETRVVVEVQRGRLMKLRTRGSRAGLRRGRRLRR